MAVELRTPLSRKVEIDGVEVVVTIDEDGVSVRLPGKVKALKLSYKTVAEQAAASLVNNRPNRELRKMFQEVGLV